MSEWIEINTPDIEINPAVEEVNMWIKADNSGNIYATLTFEQIKEIYEKIK